VVANLLTPVVLEMIDQGLESLLIPGGILITSGIRIKDADKVSAALEAKGWGEIECREMDGSCVIVASSS